MMVTGPSFQRRCRHWGQVHLASKTANHVGPFSCPTPVVNIVVLRALWPWRPSASSTTGSGLRLRVQRGRPCQQLGQVSWPVRRAAALVTGALLVAKLGIGDKRASLHYSPLSGRAVKQGFLCSRRAAFHQKGSKVLTMSLRYIQSWLTVGAVVMAGVD